TNYDYNQQTQTPTNYDYNQQTQTPTNYDYNQQQQTPTVNNENQNLSASAWENYYNQQQQTPTVSNENQNLSASAWENYYNQPQTATDMYDQTRTKRYKPLQNTDSIATQIKDSDLEFANQQVIYKNNIYPLYNSKNGVHIKEEDGTILTGGIGGNANGFTFIPQNVIDYVPPQKQTLTIYDSNGASPSIGVAQPETSYKPLYQEPFVNQQKVQYAGNNYDLSYSTTSSNLAIFDRGVYIEGTLQHNGFIPNKYQPFANPIQDLPANPNLEDSLKALSSISGIKTTYVNLDGLTTKIESMNAIGETNKRVNQGYLRFDLGGETGLVNNTNAEQTLRSLALSKAYTNTLTVTDTHGYKFDFNQKVSAKVSIPAIADISAETSMTHGYTFNKANATANAETTTYNIPDQAIKLPPGTRAVVTALLKVDKYKGEMAVGGQLEGSFKYYDDKNQHGESDISASLQTLHPIAAEKLKQRGIYLSKHENKVMFKGNMPYEVTQYGNAEIQVRIYNLADGREIGYKTLPIQS
ncbi:TPA: ETX/MTX2 family pore-forming toxin, partial [Bacillus cereus]